MAIRPTFNMGSVQQQLQQVLTQQDSRALLALTCVGELAVNQARNLKTYQDQTGNLRSSVGYVIAHNGIIIKVSFSGTAAGQVTGEGLARTLAAEQSTGWVLIVVAGMNYAVSVESKGLDVLTSAEQLAETQLPILLKQLASSGE